MVLPKFKRKIEDYLSCEEGFVVSKKMLTVGSVVLAGSVALLGKEVSAHSTHCSGGTNEFGYGCSNDGLAGVLTHSTHGSHGSHGSHGTHQTHALHLSHGTHGSHGSHGSHTNHHTHATHSTHSSHGSHSSY